MKVKNKKNGFTLVELLVVIAIIGILAVTALPALFKNIEKAKIVDLEADINTIKSAVQSAYAETGTLTYTSWAKQEDGTILVNGGLDEDEVSEQVETLSMPFGGSYNVWPEKSAGSSITSSHLGEVLWIWPEAAISEDGLKKLERDLGQSLLEWPGMESGEAMGVVIFRKDS